MSAQAEDMKSRKRNRLNVMSELDITNWSPSRPQGNFASRAAVEQMQNSMAMSQMEALERRQELARRKAELELKKEQMEIEKEEKALNATQGQPAAGQPAGSNKMADNIAQLMAQPTFLQMWSTWSEKQQKSFMTLVQTVNMSGGGGNANSLLPFLMMNQGGGDEKRKDEISMTDFMTMQNNTLKTGMDLATNAIKTNQQPQSNPVDTVKAFSELTKPLQEQVNVQQQTYIQALQNQLMENKSKASGLKETLSDIKQIADTFGGGGGREDSAVSIELQRLRNEQDRYQMQMALEIKRMDREADAEAMRSDAFTGLLSSAVPYVVPTLMGAIAGGGAGGGAGPGGPMSVKEMAKQQAMKDLQAKGQPPQQLTPPKSQLLEIDCPTPGCGAKIPVERIEGQKETTVICPKCKTEVIADFGGPQGNQPDNR